MTEKTLDMFIDFLRTWLFGILDHNWLSDIISLRFDLAAHNLWTEVFVLASNIVGNWRSDFLALGCLVDIYGPYDIGMFPEDPSGVDTMEDSRIFLYCCWSSHLPADWYIYLIFSRHLCSYKEQLINDWSTLIMTMCSFSRSGLNNPLMITHFCSK